MGDSDKVLVEFKKSWRYKILFGLPYWLGEQIALLIGYPLLMLMSFVSAFSNDADKLDNYIREIIEKKRLKVD